MGAFERMNTYFSAGDWVVILLYVLGIIALGLWFGKDQHNTRDYFLGSKNVPWWGIGLSIVAAETSALTIIGVPAMAYGGNIAFLQMIIGYVIAPILLAIVLVVLLSLLYTYIGGVKAVIWTDAVQFGLFLLGGIFALCYIPTLVDGGMSAVFSKATAAGKLHWLNVSPPSGVSLTRFLLGPPFN